MTSAASLVAGEPARDGPLLEVFNPYHLNKVGEVVQCEPHDVERALETGSSYDSALTRYERHEILMRTRAALMTRAEQFAHQITAEAGLAIQEARYEVGRASDVLLFAAIESLHDDGQIFSCDISPHGKPRKIFTTREPLRLAAAITPFNHPLNQVVHKVAPAIAANTPIVLKPSEKTPLTALAFARLLYESGLPPEMLSVVLGPTAVVAEKIVTDPRTDLVTFTGSVAVGKRIAFSAGYKRLVLELGGNDPLLVLEDADLELAVHLAAEGAFRNSGQRCTAVKRILVAAPIYSEFLERFVLKAAEYVFGDPFDPHTRVGTVIDEDSAIQLLGVVTEAVEMGAVVRLGGHRRGALLAPTVIADVPRSARMVCQESFGPLAPVLKVHDLGDAIELANSTSYGLSAGVVTSCLDSALQCISRLKTGTVNINEVPGYRIESSPFGGIKDSGLGIKEGVVEAIKSMSTVKSFSLPWNLSQS